MVEVEICDSLVIRDILPHHPANEGSMAVTYWNGDGGPCTIRVNNQLDQSCAVYIFGNRTKSASAAALPVQIGAVFTVSNGDSEMRTLGQATSGWFGNIYVRLSAAVLPTAGTISAWADGEGVIG